MEVIVIVAIAVVVTAAIVAGIIIFFTKDPPKTLVLLQTPPQANPLLHGVNLSPTKGTWVDPYSHSVNTFEPVPVYRKNARKHRASPLRK